MWSWNRDVHRLVRLSREEFLERVEFVEAIRCNRIRPAIWFFPWNVEAIQEIRAMHAAVWAGDFSGLNSIEFYARGDRTREQERACRWRLEMAGYDTKKIAQKGDILEHLVFFGLDFADPVYWWLKNNPIETIERHLIAYTSLLWLWQKWSQSYNPEFENVHPESLEAAKKLAGRHGGIEEKDSVDWRAIASDLCLAFAGTDYPGFFLREGIPSVGTCEPWGIEKYCYRPFSCYFRTKDWVEVFVRNGRDNLVRMESRTDVWRLWKEAFVGFKSLADANENAGVVYLIKNKANGNVKIGWTQTSPEARLATLQTGNDAELVLLGCFNVGSAQSECALHDRFRCHHVRGEWFTLSPDQIANLLDREWRSANGVF